MGKYSEKFRESVIKRMLLPDGESIMAITEDTGIPNQTLYNWLKKLRRNGTMKSGSAHLIGMSLGGGEELYGRSKEMDKPVNECVHRNSVTSFFQQ